LSLVLALVGLALIGTGLLWRLKLPKETMAEKVQRGGSSSEFSAASRLAQNVGTSSPETKPAVGLGGGERKGLWAHSKEMSLNPAIQSSGGEADHPLKPAMSGEPSLIAQKQRRSERILLRVPVQVDGTDANGNAFTERTYTLMVSRHGCSLHLRKSLRTNDRITVGNILMRQSCAFRVCEPAQTQQGDVTEWGAECLDPDRNFWGITFPGEVTKASPPGDIPVELECAVCRSRKIAALSPDQFRSLTERGTMTRDCPKCGAVSEWHFAFVGEESEETMVPAPESKTSEVSLTRGIENRRHERLALRLPFRIRYEDGRVETTVTEDVSKSGVCCASNLEMKVADAVFLTIEPGVGSSEEETPARVVWRRPVGEAGRAMYGIMLEGTNNTLAARIAGFSDS
jgi:PilZ domain-containing protein